MFLQRKKLNENLMYVIWHTCSFFLNTWLLFFSSSAIHAPSGLPWFKVCWDRFLGRLETQAIEEFGFDHTVVEVPYTARHFGLSPGEPWFYGGRAHPIVSIVDRHLFTEEAHRFYLVQLCFWASTFFFLLIEKRKKDHYQMLLHHMATTLMIVQSLLDSRWWGGLVVLWLHDVVDICLYVAKFLDKLKKAGDLPVCCGQKTSGGKGDTLMSLRVHVPVELDAPSFKRLKAFKTRWWAVLDVAATVWFVLFTLSYAFFRLWFFPLVIIFPLLGQCLGWGERNLVVWRNTEMWFLQYPREYYAYAEEMGIQIPAKPLAGLGQLPENTKRYFGLEDAAFNSGPATVEVDTMWCYVVPVTVLYCLHLFWFSLILKLLYLITTGKELHDTRSSDGDSDI